MLGVVTLVLAGVSLVTVGRHGLAGPVASALLVGFAIASILSIVGGLVDSVRLGGRTVTWNVLLGGSSVLLAVVVALFVAVSFGV